MNHKNQNLLCLLLLCSLLFSSIPGQAKSYDKYSTKTANWGLGLRKDHKKPGGNVPYHGFSLKKYNTIYTGKTNKKYIYLSFDCGYENGQTKKILDVLKKNKVHAIFFVTKPYIEEHPKLVKRMKKEGHLVGNHTSTHPRLSNCSVKKIRAELRGVERAMKKRTGYKIDKFLRPPEGNYSPRALKVIQDMGYTTVLWSLAWYDYDTAHQPSVNYVVNRFRTYYHKGMIPLLHGISSADTKALPQIIKFMKSKKYKFMTLDTLD